MEDLPAYEGLIFETAMKLSIVIPTYQEERRLEPTLVNLSESLTVPHEIIISDGRSSDRTLEIARRYVDKVVVYSGQGRQRPSVGRNDGAKLATGDFLVFLDSGSVIPDPDAFFARALGRFEDPRLVALTGRVSVFEDRERLSDRFFLAILNSMHMVANNILRTGSCSGRFVMLRRADFERAGGYAGGLTFHEDNDLFHRLSRFGRTYFDRGLVVYHGESRARALGWPKLISLWMLNIFWQAVFREPFSKRWDPIR